MMKCGPVRRRSSWQPASASPSEPLTPCWERLCACLYCGCSPACAAALALAAGKRISTALPHCAPCRLSSSLLDSSSPPGAEPSAQLTAPKPVADGSGAPTDAPSSDDAPLPADVFGERDIAELEARLKWVLQPGSPEAAAALAAAEAKPLEAYSHVQQEAARFERSLGLVSALAF